MSIREVARKAGSASERSRGAERPRLREPEVQRRVRQVVKELKYSQTDAAGCGRARKTRFFFVLANRDILLSLHGHIFRASRKSAP